MGDTQQDLSAASTVARARVLSVNESQDDAELVVTVHTEVAIYGSGSPATITLDDRYFLSCPNDYFTRDGRVRPGDRLIVIGQPGDFQVPGRLFVLDEGSADANRLVGQWLTLHPDGRRQPVEPN